MPDGDTSDNLYEYAEALQARTQLSYDYGGDNPDERSLMNFITLMCLGGMATGGVSAFSFGGRVAAGVDISDITAMSVEEGNFAMEDAILSKALNAEPLLTAEEQALVDANMEKIMNQGIISAGCIFFPSGL